MGWLISFSLLLGWMVNPAEAGAVLIAAGLFAIAGSISLHK